MTENFDLRVFAYKGNKVRIKLSLERTNCMFDTDRAKSTTQLTMRLQ